MPKIAYIEKRFSASSQDIIAKANVILDEYAAQGYDLTLRQLYYQFVARGYLPNTTQNYKRLGSIVDDARMTGLIDWQRIEDRTRRCNRLPSWGTPSDILDSCFQSYHLERWASQKVRVEVWVEKEALAGIFEAICSKWDVPWFACRGYVSQSEMWRAAQRIIHYERAGQKVVILHFGDHDPSGIDMTRDIRDRLRIFGAHPEIRRMALNMPQIRQYNPPPNPAKDTDARFAGYVRRFGNESWELDALDPNVLNALVEGQVRLLRDPEPWKEVALKEAGDRALLKVIGENWDKATETITEDADLDFDRTEAENELRNSKHYTHDFSGKGKAAKATDTPTDEELQDEQLNEETDGDEDDEK